MSTAEMTPDPDNPFELLPRLQPDKDSSSASVALLLAAGVALVFAQSVR